MTTNNDGPAILDSLPYYDNDLEQYPILKEKVEQELARELKLPSSIHPLVLPPLQLFKNNPLLAAELARVETHHPLPPLDAVRHQLPGPSSLPGTDQEWRQALRNAHAQLEHQRVRHTNLALLQTYGANAWRIHNYRLEETVKQAERALEELREKTTELNRERKNSQTRYGAQLTALETRWTELLSSILQIEMANVALDVEVQRLHGVEAQLSSSC
ncbi:breast carcinoma amplified sequence 2 [Scleroderma citrinum]